MIAYNALLHNEFHQLILVKKHRNVPKIGDTLIHQIAKF